MSKMYPAVGSRLQRILSERVYGRHVGAQKSKIRPVTAALGLFQGTLHPLCMLENVCGRGPGILIKDAYTFGTAAKAGADKGRPRHKSKLILTLKGRQMVDKCLAQLDLDAKSASTRKAVADGDDGVAPCLAM